MRSRLPTRSKFLSQDELEFTRRSSGEILMEHDGSLVDSAEISQIKVQGSLQPYRSGKAQMTLPDGLRSSDAYFFVTQTDIKTVDQFTQDQADICIIDDAEYVAFKRSDWRLWSGSRISHFLVLLVRKDKAPNGRL